MSFICGIAAASNSSVRGRFEKSIGEDVFLQTYESRKPAEIFPPWKNRLME